MDLAEDARREPPTIVVPGRILPAGRAGRQATVVAGLRYLEALWRAGAHERVVAPRTLGTAGGLAPATGSDQADGARPAADTGSFADAVLCHAHGLLLLGGPDVEPGRYGRPAHPATYGVDPLQDAFEMALVAAAGRQGLPVLAICRGLQLVNVAFGGTLRQHLADEPGLLPHAPPTFPRSEPGSIGTLLPVSIDPGCRLHRLLGGDSEPDRPFTVTGAHSHHQAVDAVGRDLVVVGRSSDGVVEALEHRDRWMVATQWHPEDTAADDRTMQLLFDGFVAEASTRVRP